MFMGTAVAIISQSTSLVTSGSTAEDGSPGTAH